MGEPAAGSVGALGVREGFVITVSKAGALGKVMRTSVAWLVAGESPPPHPVTWGHGAVVERGL